jgi:hypothetical protein
VQLLFFLDLRLRARGNRDTTPAPDFAHLPSYFKPTPELPPFTVHIGGNDEDDGLVPLDRTPTREPDPALATTHLIHNTVHDVVQKQMNPIVAQLNALTELVTALNEHNIPLPTATTMHASPPVAPPPTVTPPQPHAQPQNALSSNPPVAPVPPTPQAPATRCQGASEAVTVTAHIPVTNAMSEVPISILPSPIANAAEYPSLEETCLAIPSHCVKHNVENKAVQEWQWRQVPGATGPSPTPLPMLDAA